MDKKEIVASKMLAKAVITHGTKLEIVAVFEASTQMDCYFVFTAPKATSPQADWVLKTDYPAYIPSGKTLDFDAFVMRVKKLDFPNLICMVDTSVLIDREEFAEKLDKITNPVKYVRREVPNGATFNKVGRMPRKSWFRTRDRSLDSLPVSRDEVRVYVDFCQDCGKRHSIAHWPAGNTKCMGYSELVKNPGLRYVQHENGQFIFKFRAEYQAAAV